MTGEQIVEFAKRTGLRVIVTEAIMLTAISQLGERFTCQDIVSAIPCELDPCGMAPSEYLVALWIDNLVERGVLARLLIGRHAGFSMYTRGSALERS